MRSVRKSLVPIVAGAAVVFGMLTTLEASKARSAKPEYTWNLVALGQGGWIGGPLFEDGTVGGGGAISLNDGDILDIEHDLFGLEVNLASKLGEDLAEPGEALLTPAAAGALDPALLKRVVPYRIITFGTQSMPVQRLKLRGSVRRGTVRRRPEGA